MTQPDFTLEHIFDNITELPTFPKVVNQALDLLEQPNTTVDELAEVIRYDQAITANVIKITNSAHFGLPQQVTSLDTALALLGQKQIREILMASAALPYLSKPIYGYGLKASDLWAHSIGAAIVAEVVAEYCGNEDPAVLFTAALLHDIGKIVLNLYVGARLEEIALIARQEEITFPEAEWRVLGGDHAVIAADLLTIWEFPHEIVRAIRCHHDPDLYVQRPLYAMLAISNILTVQLGIGVGTDGFRNKISPDLLDVLELGREDYHILVAKSLAAYGKASDLLAMCEEN